MSSSINPQNNRDLNQSILNIWSKLCGPSLNGWWVIAYRPSPNSRETSWKYDMETVPTCLVSCIQNPQKNICIIPLIHHMTVTSWLRQMELQIEWFILYSAPSHLPNLCFQTTQTTPEYFRATAFPILSLTSATPGLVFTNDPISSDPGSLNFAIDWHVESPRVSRNVIPWGSLDMVLPNCVIPS